MDVILNRYKVRFHLYIPLFLYGIVYHFLYILCNVILCSDILHYVISFFYTYYVMIVAESLVSYAGERFDFIIEMDQPVDNYWIRFRGLMDCDERFLSAYQIAILRYEGAPEEEPLVEVSYNRTRNDSYGLVRISIDFLIISFKQFLKRYLIFLSDFFRKNW